jgi:hypothetical protein
MAKTVKSDRPVKQARVLKYVRYNVSLDHVEAFSMKFPVCMWHN